MSAGIRLFEPFRLRGVELRNRIVISPMCQYSARDGLAQEWHRVHLGQFAIGGAGLVMTEATAVEPRGRITPGDLGLWSDAHAEALVPIVEFAHAHGARIGVQLAHAGRKASSQRPWQGHGPLGADDAVRGEPPWETVGPSPIPFAEGWPAPRALTTGEIAGIVDAFAAAARRAATAGFDVAEIHAAHGYLLASFLSPLSNRREDAYGGDRAGRMRMVLEVAEAVRAAWPAERPLLCRLSCVDGLPGGWSLEDSVALARELRARGVDAVDCSSGGLTPAALTVQAGRPLPPGYQVPLAATVRREAEVPTVAVGFITDPRQAEQVLRDEAADLVAIGREALYDPRWPLHAAVTLNVDPECALWPPQYGWWLARRAAAIGRVGG